MTAKSGANSGIIIKPYLTYDTPVAPTTNDKVRVTSETFKRNTTELKEAPVGGQVIMQEDSDIGDDSPGGQLNKVLRTNDGFNAAIMNLLGTETVTTVTSGVYEHSAVANVTSLNNYLLFAKETSDATVAEYINAIMTELSLEFNVNQYVNATGTFISSQRKITSTTATNANIASATEPTNYNFIFRDTDYFYLNAQAGGALSTSDKVPVTKVEVSLMRPYEFVAEARDTAGKSAPRISGDFPFIGSVKITLKEKANDTYETAFDAGTEYKAQLKVSGPTITGNFKHYFRIDFPRLKPVIEPDYNLSGPQTNPYVITFTCLVAASAPTGMNSVYPMICLQNDKSIKYLA